MWPRTAAFTVALLACLLVYGLIFAPTQPSIFAPRDEDAAPAGRRLFFSFEYLPSLYLNYQNPSPAAQQAWFTSIDVTESTEATFFAVQRTQFGYLGLQQTLTFFGGVMQLLHLNNVITRPYYGLVIFSAWNTADGNCAVEAVGEGAYQDTFTGEGTGCQIKFETPWEGEHNDFVTTATTLATGRILLSGYWHSAVEGPWLLIGSISVPDGSQPFGQGGIASFVEQYYSSFDQYQLRMANYGPQFVQTTAGQWIPITTATFETTDSNAQAYYQAAVTTDGSQFTMGISGKDVTGSAENTPDGTVLTLTNTKPAALTAELQEFQLLQTANTLPQGCSGDVTSCGSTSWRAWLPFTGRSPFPNSPAKAVFDILLLAFIITLIVTCCFWCRPQASVY